MSHERVALTAFDDKVEASIQMLNSAVLAHDAQLQSLSRDLAQLRQEIAQLRQDVAQLRRILLGDR
jgi:phage shock protein A